jgi:hypothetical protein
VVRRGRSAHVLLWFTCNFIEYGCEDVVLSKKPNKNGGSPQAGDKPKMGRPVIEIDYSLFESLCEIQCTLPEIAGVLKVSEDTVERRVKEHYGETFAETYKKHSAPGLMSLRRHQFRMAESNATMAIWLGKQYLGQTDRMDLNVRELDATIERELAAITAGSQADTPGEAQGETVH